MVFDAKSKKAKFALKKAGRGGGAPVVVPGAYEPMPLPALAKKVAENKALTEQLWNEAQEAASTTTATTATGSVPDTGASALQPQHNKLAVPLMSEEELKPCTLSVSDAVASPERLESILSKHGFVLITGVCSAKECETLEEMWKSDLLALASPAADGPPFLQNALQRVEKNVRNWPTKTLFANKFSDKRGLQHGCFAWAARLHPNVQSVFQSYYTALKSDLKMKGVAPGFDPSDLCVSIDNTFFEPTRSSAGKNDRYWMHADYNRNASDGQEHCVQGVLYAWDATAPNTSTTVILPKSGKDVFERIMQDESCHAGGHYVTHLRIYDETLRKSVIRTANADARRIPCPAGSLLLWSSKTSHQGWSIGTRLAQPVCWQPKFNRPLEAYRKKLWLCLTGLPSTHWATIGKLHNTEQSKLVTSTSPASTEEPAYPDDLLLPLSPMLVPYGIRPDKIDQWRQALSQIYPGNVKRDWIAFSDVTLAETLLTEEVVEAM